MSSKIQNKIIQVGGKTRHGVIEGEAHLREHSIRVVVAGLLHRRGRAGSSRSGAASRRQGATGPRGGEGRARQARKEEDRQLRERDTNGLGVEELRR